MNESHFIKNVQGRLVSAGDIRSKSWGMRKNQVPEDPREDVSRKEQKVPRSCCGKEMGECEELKRT